MFANKKITLDTYTYCVTLIDCRDEYALRKYTREVCWLQQKSYKLSPGRTESTWTDSSPCGGGARRKHGNVNVGIYIRYGVGVAF